MIAYVIWIVGAIALLALINALRGGDSYRIIYHQGADIGLKTKVQSGVANVSGGYLEIRGAEIMLVPTATIRRLEFFRLHGVGRMIRIVHPGGTLYLAVVWLNLFGYFVIIDFFRTGRLLERLKRL